MKKAKIILSAIGLLSILGGALAFKAQHRFSGHLACYTAAGKFVPTKYSLGEGASIRCTTTLNPGAYVSQSVIPNS